MFGNVQEMVHDGLRRDNLISGDVSQGQCEMFAQGFYVWPGPRPSQHRMPRYVRGRHVIFNWGDNQHYGKFHTTCGDGKPARHINIIRHGARAGEIGINNMQWLKKPEGEVNISFLNLRFTTFYVNLQLSFQ